jgi:hypothetical protein
MHAVSWGDSAADEAPATSVASAMHEVNDPCFISSS